MSKKIVVITGSPRKDGNSFAMTDAFIKSAEAKGHAVTRFDAAIKKEERKKFRSRAKMIQASSHRSIPGGESAFVLID